MTSIVDRARALAPDIIAARDRLHEQRRLPDDLARKFRDAQLYRLCIPKAHGGLEASPRTLVETLEVLAEADSSAAWCVTVGATSGSFGAYLESDVASSILGNPDLILAGVYAPMGKAEIEGDNYRVSGRWKWNSGGQNATWLCGGCMIHENGAPKMLAEKLPEHRMMLFPASDVEFIDTWHTNGLRGSGSGDMTVTNLIVPKSRSVSLISDKPRVATPLYAFPVFGLLAIGIAAVASGNAQAALAEFVATASDKRTPGGRKLAERATVQASFAQGSAKLLAARAFLMSEIDASWIEAQSTPAISLSQRARLRLAATHMARTAAEIVRDLQDLSGGNGVFLANTLNRRLADAQTMTAHMMVAPATYELTGRALLGVPLSAAEL
jgi:alkylation response protein AidB-like acyl-CoA dehydrogenase